MPTGALAGANIEHAGAHNQRVILQAIRVYGPVTKAELARLTGLTHPTVTNITNRLLALDLLRGAGQRRGGRGQPATRLIVNPNGAYSIGINIDRDHITMVVVDFGGEVRAQATLEVAFPLPDQVQAFYRRELDRLLADAGVASDAIVGIGVALPDGLGEIALPGRPAAYAQWTTTRVATLFEAPLPVPVHVENDAAAAAIGEMQFGLGQRLSSFFYILITFALGGGLVVHSLYDRGADGRSGEIGFLMVDDGGGEPAQLQSIVSLAGLSRRLAAAGAEHASARSPDLSDPVVRGVVDEWIEASARALVQPLIAINCLINPEAVLIGGRAPRTIIEAIAKRANALLRMQGRNAPTLAPVGVAALAEDASAVGAALLSFADLLTPQDRGSERPNFRTAGVVPHQPTGAALSVGR